MPRPLAAGCRAGGGFRAVHRARIPGGGSHPVEKRNFHRGAYRFAGSKRIVLKTPNGQQRVVNKTAIRRIVYDAGLGARLIAEQKTQAAGGPGTRKRNKALEAERARKAAELAKQQEQDAERNKALEAERQRREAREARGKYAAAFQDYERRARAESERLAREEELRKSKKSPKKKGSRSSPKIRPTNRKRCASIAGGALWRSAILPGWGQFYADQPVMGTAYSGLFAFAAVNSYKFAAHRAFVSQRLHIVHGYQLSRAASTGGGDSGSIGRLLRNFASFETYSR